MATPDAAVDVLRCRENVTVPDVAVSDASSSVVGAWIEFVFLIVLFVVGVVGNAVVVVFYRPIRDQSVHVFFVFALGVVDLLTSLLVIPNSAFFTFVDFVRSSPHISRHPECRPLLFWYRCFVSFLLNSLLLLSCFLFVGIAVDRLEAVASPLRRRFHPRLARRFLLASVAAASLLVVFLLVDENPVFSFATRVFKSGDDGASYNVSKLLFDAVVVLCFVVLVVVYVIVFVLIRRLGLKRAAAFRRGKGASTDFHGLESGAENKARPAIAKKDAELQRRTLLVATLITGFFVGSWLPVLMIQHWLVLPSFPVLRKVVFVNSVVNPIVYAFTNGDFRAAIARRFCRGSL